MYPFHIFSGTRDKNDKRYIGKSSSFKNTVVFVNGFNGSGKTLLAPIVSALPKVELASFAYPIEWASMILYSGNLTPSAYEEFVKMYVDESIYNQQMSRSVNFRFSDLSSVFKSTKKLTYFLRLFQKGDDHVVEIIKNKSPISCFTTNYLLPFFPSLHGALNKRLVFIETVKDPLTMFEQAHILRRRIINTSSEKDFTFRSFSGRQNLNFLDLYASEKLFTNNDILSLEANLVEWLERVVDFTINFESRNNRSEVFFVPFENFVINPMPILKEISRKIGVNIDKNTLKEMKKQKVPRKILSAGLKLPIYRRYGAKNTNYSNLEDERNNTLLYVKNLINDNKSFEKLVNISEKYNIWRKEYIGKYFNKKLSE
ncbi:hypothetical protein OAS37_02245 [Alphaproteobacteria bacterium]|nr:hypothetical protein [Alphaproteobacteria bacterium]